MRYMQANQVAGRHYLCDSGAVLLHLPPLPTLSLPPTNTKTIPSLVQGKWLVLIPLATANKAYSTTLVLAGLGMVPLLILAPVPLLLSLLSQFLTLLGAFACALGGALIPPALSPALPLPYLAHPWLALGAFSALALAGALAGGSLGHAMLAAYLAVRRARAHVAPTAAPSVAAAAPTQSSDSKPAATQTKEEDRSPAHPALAAPTPAAPGSPGEQPGAPSPAPQESASAAPAPAAPASAAPASTSPGSVLPAPAPGSQGPAGEGSGALAASVEAWQWQALSGLLLWVLLLQLAASYSWSSALVPVAWAACPALACETLCVELPLRLSVRTHSHFFFFFIFRHGCHGHCWTVTACDFLSFHSYCNLLSAQTPFCSFLSFLCSPCNSGSGSLQEVG